VGPVVGEHHLELVRNGVEGRASDTVFPNHVKALERAGWLAVVVAEVKAREDSPDFDIDAVTNPSRGEDEHDGVAGGRVVVERSRATALDARSQSPYRSLCETLGVVETSPLARLWLVRHGSSWSGV